jgi:ATP-dependent Lhr-like helicase
VVEERFAAKLKPGDCFAFAGRLLEHVRIRDMTLWVRKCRGRKGPVPQWLGGRMPLSTQLSDAVQERLDKAHRNIYETPDIEAVRPLLEIQAHLSVIPRKYELLIETLKTRDGNHLFVFTFAGHLVNEGLGTLFSYRLSKTAPLTLSIATNDYGLELLSDRKIPSAPFNNGRIFSTDDLLMDILESVNVSEMAQRQFRGISRVAGLVFQGYPGRRKSWGQVQASSSLLYKVFQRYDPGNLLIEQSTREVLERQLEIDRLSTCLKRLQSARLQLVDTSQPTPLAFPIMVNRMRTKISSEKLADRVRRLQLTMIKSAEKRMNTARA